MRQTLQRAGAYFHDIGKIQLPTYFIENQQGENPHDKIPPLESASKLRSHTEAGVTIARGANLLERIIDFIIEHHGRSTMEYFMDKAYKTDGKVPAVRDYSYNGRNPTSRETAILMIVDSMEARHPAMISIDSSSRSRMPRSKARKSRLSKWRQREGAFRQNKSVC